MKVNPATEITDVAQEIKNRNQQLGKNIIITIGKIMLHNATLIHGHKTFIK